MDNVLLYLFAAGYYILGLGIPAAMIATQLFLAWPIVWSSRTVSTERRTAAGALALVCLLSAVPTVPGLAAGQLYGLSLLVAFTVPAAITLVRLHQTSRPSRSGEHRGG